MLDAVFVAHHLQRAEHLAEARLLLAADRLVANDEHRMLVPGAPQPVARRRIDRLAQIEAARSPRRWRERA